MIAMNLSQDIKVKWSIKLFHYNATTWNSHFPTANGELSIDEGKLGKWFLFLIVLLFNSIVCQTVASKQNLKLGILLAIAVKW